MLCSLADEKSRSARDVSVMCFGVLAGGICLIIISPVVYFVFSLDCKRSVLSVLLHVWYSKVQKQYVMILGVCIQCINSVGSFI